MNFKGKSAARPQEGILRRIELQIPSGIVTASMLATLLGVLLVPVSSSAATCAGVTVRAGANLQAAINNRPAGTRFCLAAARYSSSSAVRPKSGDVFVGKSPGLTHISTGAVGNVIVATKTRGVVFRGLSISGARGGSLCQPNCGRGISGGVGLTLGNVHVHHNMNQGVGGVQQGLQITNSTFDHNGSTTFLKTASLMTAAGVKSKYAFSVRGSYFHDNTGPAVWCDLGCYDGTFRVEHNVLVNNNKGVFYERSGVPTVIRYNRIQGNMRGIAIEASSNADVYENTLGQNSLFGIRVGSDPRHPTRNVRVHHNDLNGDSLIGCDLSDTVCGFNR